MNDELQNSMASVFVEWAGRGPGDDRPVPEIEAAGCFGLHRLQWQESIIAEADGRKICRYRAPDAESVRLAFRQGGVSVDAIWTGSVLGGDDAASANVVVERTFRHPLPADAPGALDIMRSAWLRPHGFRLISAIVPCSRERIICLCEAPAPARLRQTGVDASIWACRVARPPAAAPDLIHARARR
jgi:hypothetical protein